MWRRKVQISYFVVGALGDSCEDFAGFEGMAFVFSVFIVSVTEELFSLLYRYPSVNVFITNTSPNRNVSFAKKPVGPFATKPDRHRGDIISDAYPQVFDDYMNSGRGPVYMDCRAAPQEDIDYMTHWLSHEGNEGLLTFLKEEGIDFKILRSVRPDSVSNIGISLKQSAAFFSLTNNQINKGI